MSDARTAREPGEILAGALSAATAGGGLALVVTGAGISAPSGIATFRGSEPEAVWKQHDVEMATEAFFRRDPAAQWSWYLGRFDRVLAAEPNPAHHALAALERWATGRGGRLLVVTQNVDTLHERAGQRDLVKVHGSADRFRCSRHGCRLGTPEGSIPRSEVDLEPFRADPVAARVPTCPACGALLRAHALFFDEYYQEHADYGFDRLVEAVAEAGVVLFAGTSLAVGATEMVLRAAWTRGVPVLLIDPAGRRPGVPEWIEVIAAPAERALPDACRRLGVDIAA